MATRDKKARSVTADSPTPSLGSANSGSNSNISALAATPTTSTTAPASDSAPTTPTSTRKGTGAGGAANVNSSAVGGSNTGGSGSSSTSSSNTRSSLSRLKSKQLQQNAGDEPTLEESDPIVTTPSSRTTRGGGALPREDSLGRDSPATTTLTPKDKEDATNTSITSASKDLKKTTTIAARRATASKSTVPASKNITEGRKNRVVTLKRTSLLKRKGKKIIGKPMLGRKVVARRQLVAAAKATGTRGAAPVHAAVLLKKEVIPPTATTSKEKLEDEEVQSTPSLRNGKPRNSDSPVAKRKSVAVVKQPESSKSPDSLLGSAKLERRRSVSVSKCSDVTEDGDPSTAVEIKRELLDYESRSKMLGKMAEAFNEPKASGAASPVVAGGVKDDKGQSSGGTLRRSMRQRKSTARDKEDFLPPRGKTGLEIKIEPLETGDALETMSIDGDAENVIASVAAPLTIDTTEVDVPVGSEALHSDGAASSVGSAASGGSVSAVGGGGEELTVGKDPSLSPGELVSEGVSEQSVKDCYGEPAFLENNLGIEKDPKLGEIVQERFRCDKVSDESGGANAEDDAKNATSDSGGGGGDDDDVVVVVVTKEDNVVIVEEEASDEIKEVEVVEEDVAEEETEEMAKKDKVSGVEDEQKTIADEKEEEEKFEDANSSVDDEEDEPMRENVVTSEETTAQIKKDSKIEDEQMEIVEEDEKEGVKTNADLESTVVVEEDTVMVDLDETVVAESSLETAEHTAEEVALEESKLDTLLIDDDDECNEVTKSSSPANAAVVDESEVSNSNSSAKITESSTDKRLASSSPATVAGNPSKANGEANGTVVASASEQSTPNQQTLSRSQQKSGSGTSTPKPVKPSSSTVTGSGNGKESKPKTRTTKEKSKDDEKTREEKLRQEKLRVEEKVREEKQRAERLEAEKRLKEELLQQQRQKEGFKSGLENGLEEEVSIVAIKTPKSGGSSPTSHTISTADKENKTEPTTAAALLSLGGLNLPAITIAITKKETGASNSSDESQQPCRSELEILPIKADQGGTGSVQPPAVVLLSKDEKPAKEGVATGATAPSLADTAESRLRIISKSEKAAAAVTTLTDRKDGGNKSPTALSIIKIESSNGSPVEASPDATVEEAKPASNPIRLLDESDDAAKRKESHLKHLGLLTIRAACEEKQRRAEQKPSTVTSGTDSPSDGSGSASVAKGDAAAASAGGGEGWLPTATNQSSAGSSSRSSTGGNKSTRSSKDEYTVSMKTVLKGSGSGGSRGEKRKQQRMPLKMTFQKGKGKGTSASGTTGRDSSNGSGTSSNGSGYATDTGNNGDTAFYTVHSNELDHHSSNSSDGHSHRESGAAGGRKTHSRSHTTDGVNLTEAVGESVGKEVIQKALVIPEKASSFNVHPERLCRDQCSYCGGKFGLYDTPCHVAAIKSTERQERILLATLPKITLDSCLCDACYRHVDRKANCPPQKKKSSTVAQTGSATGASAATNTVTTQSTVSPLVLKVTTNKDGSTSIATEQPATMDDGPTAGGKAREICAVRQCTAHALQTLRRKWMVKMKRKIGKQLDINLEQAAKATAEYISICNKHYEQISHLMVCAMCSKPLQRNHVYHMYNNIPQLERLIQEQGISMRLSSSELVVCKLCKYYANLLVKPPDAKSKKAQFVKDYSRRLYNYRQRVADEQEEQEVQLQSVETMVVPVAPPRPIPVDIVISDGDEEEEVAEEDDVEMCAEPQQLQQQQEQQRYQMLGDLFSIGDSSVSVRRRVSNRKSPEVTIVENNGTAQMGELGEITIIPTSKSLSASATNHQQQRDDNIDMTKVLKSNPNISMRELFPGEEELGVHVNIPFSASSVRTPEGWTKVTSTMQYDDSTRALWEELQKPYGNQSSFLRHLILLEKYFRNGDLVLSPQAKNNATTYSEAVQNRLRSYDNVSTSSFPASPPALASLTPAASVAPAVVDKTSSIFQQFSSATITIVPASKVRPKAASVSLSTSAAGTPVSPPAPVSLLKSNNLHLANSGESSTKNSLKRKLSNEGGRTVSAGGNASLGGSITSPLNNNSSGGAKVGRLDEPKVPQSSPPELISINNRKSSVTITSIPQSGGQSTPASAAPAPALKQLSLLNQSPQQSLLQNAPNQPKKSPATAQAAGTSTSSTSSTTTTPTNAATATGNTAREIIKMPEHLTETERREMLSGRPWRPTLLPYVPEDPEKAKTSPLYQTADGRLLPGGNSASTSAASAAKLVQFPNQLLEQNSLIPIMGGGAAKSTNAAPKSSLMVTMTTTVNNNSLAKTTAVQLPPPPPAMKPLSLPNSTTVFPMMISANTISLPSTLSTASSSSSSSSFATHASASFNSSSRPTTSGSSLVLGQPTSLISSSVVPMNPFDQLLKGGNMVTQAQLQEFVAATTAANGGGSSSSTLMDNSPAQLLSKIPKSLTVIPQQKQRSMSRVSSHEDQNSA
uniref:Uncharacterized protein n=1 Tax=Anopheles dirus TaxID=7168 RepID=A0A182NR52_9DIPT